MPRHRPDHWDRVTGVTVALLPLAGLFRVVTVIRRALFRIGLLQSYRMPVPVIVVGNITAGGTGKTPFVLWLVQQLRARGQRPGIVTRGYGARDAGPAAVMPETDPADAGDEPVLLARRSECPVWRGIDRGRAARALLAEHPECDVIVSDDGLQHYRLARDMEIALVDGARGLGNGLPIPAGPMREPARRLDQCDFVVVKAPRRATISWRGAATDMTLRTDTLVNLRDPSLRRTPSELAGVRVHAVAGIGQPDQFFDSLRALGLAIVEHPFPDHHAFRPADLTFDASDMVVMTEKDAVKCRAFASEGWWMLPVEAQLPPGFAQRIFAGLPHGPRPETA